MELKACPECKTTPTAEVTGDGSIKITNLVVCRVYDTTVDAYVYEMRCGFCGTGAAYSWIPDIENIAGGWNYFVDKYFRKCCGQLPKVDHPQRMSKYVPAPETVATCEKCGRTVRSALKSTKARFDAVKREWNAPE